MLTRIVCIILTCCLFASCKNRKTNSSIYFDFDEVIHYSIIPQFDVFGPDQFDTALTEMEQLRYQMMIGPKPESLSDSTFISNLEAAGFNRQGIDEYKFDSLNQIFMDKPVSEILEGFCLPVFRDILIFKKRHKVIGVVKICFGCEKALIVGSQANTIGFGQDGDFQKLKKLLHN